MVPHLPNEIIFRILECAYHLPDGRRDVKTIGACAAVCRQWTPIAQELQFHTKAIGRNETYTTDEELALLNGPSRLGDYIRDLHVHVGLGAHTTNFDLGPPITQGALDVRSFVGVLARCPRLYQLKLVLDVHHFSADELALLAALPVNIRALDLACASVTSTALYQLFALWPHIHTLCLRTELIAPTPATRPDFSLYELCLIRSVRPPVLQWLLPPLEESRAPDLRILDFWDVPHDYPRDLITQYAPHVRSLRLASDRPAELITPFTALEEFVLRTIPDLLPLPPLPHSVHHIRFHTLRSPPSPLQTFKHAIATMKALPDLERVTVSKTVADRQDFGDFLKACDEKGLKPYIDLNYIQLPEYPVPVDHFPRLRTIENMYRMNSNA
ncbi:hypothetical protein DENSPDRAFT_807353 [Dentipellis sp. KUC8613]|nr:hypothetical protein DENSPDRAFT_807353 [Dentipellis sp. KUC8613]